MATATQWVYRVEGNNNVVFTNVNKQSILRLPKISNAKHKRHEDRLSNGICQISNEMEFLEHVVYKILNGVRIGYRGEWLEMSKDFIQELAARMKDERPESCRDEKLDESVRYGLLLPNFCKLFYSNRYIPRSMNEYPVVSVELRPKTCYFPTFDTEPHAQLKNKCFFCLSMLYRELRNPKFQQTEYCPCDLYSGDVLRIKRALNDLIRCPQRYFSVRINDETVFSAHTLAKKYAERKNIDITEKDFYSDSFNSSVCPVFGKSDCNNGREAFLNLLCNCLQSNITNTRSKKAVSSVQQHCRRKSAIDNACGNVCPQNDSRGHTILDFLATIHGMMYLPMSSVKHMHSRIKNHIKTHSEDASLLSLDSPYNIDLWKRATALPLTNGVCGPMTRVTTSAACGNDSRKITGSKADVIESAEILRRFIIARGFSCCSLIVSLQKINSTTSTEREGQHGVGTMLVSDGFGSQYLSSISILDLYKDPPNQVDKYCRREMEITSFLNDYFSSKVSQ